MLKTVILFLGLSSIISYIGAMSEKKINVHSPPSIIRHGKQKRFLIEPLFSTGSHILKAVLGIAFPLEILDKVNFRTMVLGYNFQAQYMLMAPTTPPWQFLARSLQNQKEYYLDNNETVAIDNTRQVVYNAIEILMNRNGINGRECIQRAICENAQSPITVTGIFHEILNLFLTPNEKNIDHYYKDAMNAGANDADCLQLYKNCPMGRGIFDSFFQFIH